MKRLGYLYGDICQPDNIELADDNARKHKTKKYGVIKHDKNRKAENESLMQQLLDLSYQTSEYSTFKIYEPKERLIFRLPYYPDRITHHAIMNIMEPIWVSIFIEQTYSCIKTRGIHKLEHTLQKVLREHPSETVYCLKLDIKKFYPSINHDILMDILRLKIKDPQLLSLLQEIIDSADGVPIGNYLSQFFANLYLAYFDHWVKEELKCKFYFRYADDIVILDSDKNHLRNIFLAIRIYMTNVLSLELKPNYQIFPVDSRGIDFVGYRFYHTHTLLRKSIKKNMFKLIDRYKSGKICRSEFEDSMQSYFGWLKHCDSKNLLTKIDKLTGFKLSNWNGIETNISNFYGKTIYIMDIVPSSKAFRIDFVYKGKSYSCKSQSRRLFKAINKRELPTNFKIESYVRTKENRDEHPA